MGDDDDGGGDDAVDELTPYTCSQKRFTHIFAYIYKKCT
jgi:hypothetical protein